MSPEIPKKKILVIGSHTEDQNFYVQALPHYLVLCTQLSEQSWLALQNESWDLILLGTQLEEDPIKLLKKINSLTKKEIPVILLTNAHQEKLAVSALKEGVADYLSREELIPAILDSVISRTLEHKKWEKLYRSLSKENESTLLQDPQTGLYNEYYFQTRLKEEAKRSERYDFSVTLLLIKIDQLPMILNSYGTTNISHLLRECAQVLLRNIRSSDLLAKMKGDCFALLLPHTTLEQGKIVATRLSNAMKQSPITLQNANMMISLRITLAPLNPKTESLELFLKNLTDHINQEQTNPHFLSIYNSDPKK